MLVEMAVIARLASALADTPRLKTVHRTVFLTAVSITFHSINKRAPQGHSFIFGGDGGNRNRVRNHLAKGSTSVVYYLGFPQPIGNKQPIGIGSLLYLTEAKALFRSCSPLNRRSVRSRGTLRQNASR